MPFLCIDQHKLIIHLRLLRGILSRLPGSGLHRSGQSRVTAFQNWKAKLRLITHFQTWKKGVSGMSTPLQIWGNASLKLRSGATSAKMSGFKDGVTKWDHSPAGQNPRCTPKVHGFWTKLSERSMLNYPGVAQRKIEFRAS